MHPRGGKNINLVRSRMATIAAAALATDAAPGHQTVTGLDVLEAEQFAAFKGKRIGLITNHTGIDRQFRSSVDCLRASDRLRLAALFGPEHGVRGAAQAGVEVAALEVAGDVAQGGGGELGVQEPAVAGHAAAGGAGRDDHVVGQLAGERFELGREAQVTG